MLVLSSTSLCLVTISRLVFVGASTVFSHHPRGADACHEIEDASSFLQISKSATHGFKHEARTVPDVQPAKRTCKDFELPDKEYQKSTLVIVRTHIPSPGMLKRMTEFAEDLHAHPQVSMMLMTSIDDTDLASPWREQIDSNVSEIPHTIFHQTDVDQVTEEFPIWRKTEYTHMEKNDFGHQWRPSGRDSHIEFILQAAKKIGKSGKLDDDGYVWVFEDDVGICGSMSEFIANYSYDNSDFIATHHMKKAAPAWRHFEEASEHFREMYPPDNRYLAYEQVQRFSVRFLVYLNDLIGTRGVTAHSEMFPATVCQNSGEFQCSILNPEHFVDWAFSEVSRIDEKDWNKICPSTQHCHTPPKLGHSLKW